VKAFLVGVALLIALAGCGDKKVTGPAPGPGPPLPSTPINILTILSIAYSHRDTTECKLLYDDNYVGTSTDQSDGSSLTFSKANEVGHVGALARNHLITTVLLQFPPGLTRFTDAGDPPGWATIQVLNLNLVIEDSPTSLYLNNSGEMNEFKFVPTTPAADSPTDTSWKIIRWTEIHN
jgi:hypothetical protein